ncbi:hypothetical protein GCM10017635_04160 [Paracoccus kondratievae]|uniref:RHS repeat protein n=2 Tax=Paracoccus kondratievae TaxID=135740 RepID=A0AAD3NVY1_9RHOB|nr:RHS repeat domain-containing protein [Paracoccus kondratievae]GLK62947.1 hypothetical protein GCM10017635_04160 [Paracoccus kondratievae]
MHLSGRSAWNTTCRERLTRLSHAGHSLTFACDQAGRLTRLTNENGEHATFAWDTMDRLTQERPDRLLSPKTRCANGATRPDCLFFAAHGLRKAICRRIAEAEGDVFKVMAVSRYTDIKEAQKYCDRFNRKGQTNSAITGVPDEVVGEPNLTNPS